MNEGDKVFVIPHMKFGVIGKVVKDRYFVFFNDGLGYWYHRSELTEGI